MKRHILILATAIAVLAPAMPDMAAPLNRNDVAADPALLVHVDCDALSACAIGQAILNEPETQDKLAAIGALIDFDLRKQLHGLTVYTTMDHPKDGALIVYADFNPDRLITLAKGAGDFQSVTNGSHVIYSWMDDKKKGSGGSPTRVYGAIVGHRVIFGQNEAHLAEALEVISGNAPHFGGNRALPAPAAGETALVQGVMLKFDFDSPDPNAAIFKMSKSVRLQLSEAGTNLTAAVHFEAVDADTASQIGAIAQGLLAILKLQKADANAVKLANAIVIKQDGPTVGLTITQPSSAVIDMIKEDQAKKNGRAQNASTPPDNTNN